MHTNEAPGELELVRQFINTRDIEKGSDEFHSPDSLLGWFARMNLLDEDGATADETDLERVVAGNVCLTVRFDDDGSPTLEPESSGVSGALGHILAAVVRAADEGIWGRLKACANDACQWAFYDRSKNHSGKWCTMEVCGNRMKARTFRQRQASGKGRTD